jgi:hypothetical protein
MGIHGLFCNVAATLVVCDHCIEEKKSLLMVKRSDRAGLHFSSTGFARDTPASTTTATASVIAALM